MCFPSAPKALKQPTVLRDPSTAQVAESQGAERRLRIARGGSAATSLTTPLGLTSAAPTAGAKTLLGQ